MAIEIKESFEVEAPVEKVWQFMLDPHEVAQCMPFATVDEIVSEDTFLGSVKVKIGPISASYKGKVHFTEVDAENHVVKLVAEGLDTSGGQARATVSSRMTPLDAGRTQVVAETTAEISGRVAQMGSRMIKGVAAQIFKRFANSVKQRLESREAA